MLPIRARVLLGVAVVVHIIAAWFNGGFLHPDEHYQIIEFAQHKLGRQAASLLAWEFGARIRPGLQPWLAAGVIQAAFLAGISSPFLIAFMLRLVSTALAMWVTLELSVRLLPTIQSPSLRVVAVAMSLCLWMAPTVHGRFSSENWAGALLCGGLCLMLDTAEAWPARPKAALLLAICTGVVWSASFYCRFQIGLLIAGAGFWLLAIRRLPVALVAVIGAAFVAACGLNELIDYWLYGSWVLTPYNYLVVQVVRGKAAEWGVAPWWILGVYMTLLLIPPYSVVALAVFAAGFWYARRHVLVWATVPFLVGHAIVLHKEPRFLIPLLYVAGPLFAVSVEAIPETIRAPLFAWCQTRAGRVNLTLLCAANLLLLSAVIVLPADDTSRVLRFLWDQSRDRPIVVYTIGGSPYTMVGVANSFYRSQNVSLVPIDTAVDMAAAVHAGPEAPAFVFSHELEPPTSLAGACSPVLRTFPAWLPRFDYFHLLASANLATLCRVEGSP